MIKAPRRHSCFERPHRKNPRGRGINKAELVSLTILGLVIHGHRMGLDVIPRSFSRSMESSSCASISDPRCYRSSATDDRKGNLSVIDVSVDAEISDEVRFHADT